MPHRGGRVDSSSGCLHDPWPFTADLQLRSNVERLPPPAMGSGFCIQRRLAPGPNTPGRRRRFAARLSRPCAGAGRLRGDLHLLYADGDEAYANLDQRFGLLLHRHRWCPARTGIEVARLAAARDPKASTHSCAPYSAMRVALAKCAREARPQGHLRYLLAVILHLREIVAEVELYDGRRLRKRRLRRPKPPAGGLPFDRRSRTRSSAGEHYVDIVGVAGSIPAASTIQSCAFASVTSTRQVRPTIQWLASDGDGNRRLRAGDLAKNRAIFRARSLARFQKCAFTK